VELGNSLEVELKLWFGESDDTKWDENGISIEFGWRHKLWIKELWLLRPLD